LWLIKGDLNETVWRIAAGKGHFEILEKLWEWVKIMQLKPE
jgi:hypothetical protein